MNLQGQKVKITISEPWDWEENIIGVVLSDREKNTLLVKLSNPIKGKEITSDLMELRLRHEKTSFESLSQHSDIAINGALIKDNNFDFIIIGSVILV